MQRQPLSDLGSARALVNVQGGRQGAQDARSPKVKVSVPVSGTENQTQEGTPKRQGDKGRKGHLKTASVQCTRELNTPSQRTSAASRRRSMIPVLVSSTNTPAIGGRANGLASITDENGLILSVDHSQSFIDRLSDAPLTPKSSQAQSNAHKQSQQARLSPSAVPVPVRTNSSTRVISGIKPSKGTVNLRRALLGDSNGVQGQGRATSDESSASTIQIEPLQSLNSIIDKANRRESSDTISEISTTSSTREASLGRKASQRRAARSSLGLGMDGAPIPELSPQTQDILRSLNNMSSSRQTSQTLANSGRSGSASSLHSHGSLSKGEGENGTLALGSHLVLPSNPTNDLVAAANATKRGSATPSSRAINALAAELHTTQSLLESTRSQLRLSQHQQETLASDLFRVKEGRESLRKEIESLNRTLERKERAIEESKGQARLLECRMESWEAERAQLRREAESAQETEEKAHEKLRQMQCAYDVLNTERQQSSASMTKDVKALAKRIRDLESRHQDEVMQMQSLYQQLVAKYKDRESTTVLLERLKQMQIDEFAKGREKEHLGRAVLEKQVEDLRAKLANSEEKSSRDSVQLESIRIEFQGILNKIRAGSP